MSASSGDSHDLESPGGSRKVKLEGKGKFQVCRCLRLPQCIYRAHAKVVHGGNPRQCLENSAS